MNIFFLAMYLLSNLFVATGVNVTIGNMHITSQDKLNSLLKRGVEYDNLTVIRKCLKAKADPCSLCENPPPYCVMYAKSIEATRMLHINTPYQYFKGQWRACLPEGWISSGRNMQKSSNFSV